MSSASDFEPMSLGILLPVGISFYTFESLSYVIDVYRRRIEASRSLLDYGLYVTFFPHLVAGPILRYGDFSPQCAEPKSWASDEVGKGLALFIFGLALKVCLADLVFAPVVDRVFAAGAQAGFGESWLGAASFSLQAYLRLRRVFAVRDRRRVHVRLPLSDRISKARSARSAWPSCGRAGTCRWRAGFAIMSLFRWAAIGGAGCAAKPTCCSHFYWCGLWHGAAWTFVIWGGLQGVFICGEHLVKRYVWDFGKVDDRFGRAALAVATFGMFSIAAVFFRAHSLRQGASIMASMFVPGAHSTLVPFSEALVAIVLGASVVGSHILFGHLRRWDWLDRWPVAPRAISIALALAAVMFSPGFNPAFIYFQF